MWTLLELRRMKLLIFGTRGRRTFSPVANRSAAGSLTDSSRLCLSAITVFLLTSAACPVGFAQSPEASSNGKAGQNRGDLYVISVALEEYRDPQLKVWGCDPTMEVFADYFTRNAGPFDNVSRRDISDGRATKATIVEALQLLAPLTKPQDTVVLFLGGHGCIYPGETLWHFCTYECPLHPKDVRTLAESSLSLREIEGLMFAIPAQKQLIFINACYSGLAGGEVADFSSKVAQTSARRANGFGVALICSCKANQETIFSSSDLTALVTSFAKNFERLVGEGKGTLYANALVTWVNAGADLDAKTLSSERPSAIFEGNDFPLAQISK
jgi:hypothetical protein